MIQSNKKIIGIFIGGIVLGALISYGVILSKQKKNSVDITSAIGTPLIKVDGQVYTTSQLPGDSAMEYYMLENSIYAARQNLANQIGIRIALAKDAQKKVDANSLPKLTELLPNSTVSDAEAKQYYDKIVAQMGQGVFGGQSFEQIKTQLELRMNQQKSSTLVSSKAQELQTGGRLQFLMKQPIAPAIALDLSGYPVRGNPNATVTLVEVADYLCPHCREAQPIVESLFKEYSQKIKFIHISFPLAPSGLSGALTRGAFCAYQQDQSRFWKYNELAYQVSWDKNQVPAGQNPADYYNGVVQSVAFNAGLGAVTFKNCLVSAAANDYIKKVGESFNESKGFQGTPTFYLNNRVIQASPDQLAATLGAALKN